MQARTKRRAGSPIFAAIGVAIVARDHQMTPNPSTCLPPMLSAQIPPAICNDNQSLDCHCHNIFAYFTTVQNFPNYMLCLHH